MDATELAKSTVAAATVRWVLVMRTAPFQATSTPLEPFEGATVTHPVLHKRKLGAQSLSAGWQAGEGRDWRWAPGSPATQPGLGIAGLGSTNSFLFS